MHQNACGKNDKRDNIRNNQKEHPTYDHAHGDSNKKQQHGQP